MTIMVKTSVGGQKQSADVMVMPLIEIEESQRPENRPRKPPAASTRSRQLSEMRSAVLMSVMALFLIIIGFVSGMYVLSEFFDHYGEAVAKIRYRGSCAISTTHDTNDYVVLKEAPTTASWYGVPTAEMQVYSAASDLISSKILNNLLEDMSIEDEIESIYVYDGPRSFKVVHDFNENYTNIISPQRCFLMDMIRQFVLEPSSLIASFRNDSALDLSHAHTVFRADLPAAAAPARRPAARYPSVARPCLADRKPIYRLNLEGTHVLHKRSVEVRSTPPPAPATPAPPAAAPRNRTELPKNDFVQFSGKHLQRITITNLDDVLKYEQDNNILQAHPGQAAHE